MKTGLNAEKQRTQKFAEKGVFHSALFCVLCTFAFFPGQSG
jgi:hypothetical protein